MDSGLLKGLKTDEFPRGKDLSLTYLQRGAERLYKMVHRTGLLNPDLIIGNNQGGMAVAAMMNKWFRKPLGYVQTEHAEVSEKGTRKLGRRVKYVSLPREIPHSSEQAGEKLAVKGILVIDTKLKTGDSAKAIHDLLRREYGDDVTIAYAVVLGYGGWNGRRWKIWHKKFPWFVRFVPKDLNVYVSYYTDLNADDDTIPEPIQHLGQRR
jgi:hypoxanthine phosphoribosyltransferase